MANFFSTPSNSPYVSNQEDFWVPQDGAGGGTTGGNVILATAHQALKLGDIVYWHPGGRVDKSLESSLYACRFAGVVVGGAITDYKACNSTGLIGTQVAALGEKVLVQTTGVCYVAADATTVIRFGDPVGPGRTTAGRCRSDQLVTAATTAPGLVIKAGASAIVKAANVTQTIVVGKQGTATAANLDMAALAGTVTNAKFNVYALRVAADGTTVTSAMGTEGAALLNVVWPTGSVTVATLGFIIVNPTGTGNFVGGTTALDDATVVPNVKYVDMVMNYPRLGVAMTAVTPAAGDAFLMLIG